MIVIHADVFLLYDDVGAFLRTPSRAFEIYVSMDRFFLSACRWMRALYLLQVDIIHPPLA